MPWAGLLPPAGFQEGRSASISCSDGGEGGWVGAHWVGAAGEHGSKMMGQKLASWAGGEILGRCRSHGLAVSTRSRVCMCVCVCVCVRKRQSGIRCCARTMSCISLYFSLEFQIQCALIINVAQRVGNRSVSCLRLSFKSET